MLLDNVYVVPMIKRNLISISCLLEQCNSISFWINEAFISKRGVDICSAKPENNLYVLRPIMAKAILNTELFKTSKTQTKG